MTDVFPQLDRNNCVELADTQGWAFVRDSKLGDTRPILSLGNEEWSAFLAAFR